MEFFIKLDTVKYIVCNEGLQVKISKNDTVFLSLEIDFV